MFEGLHDPSPAIRSRLSFLGLGPAPEARTVSALHGMKEVRRRFEFVEGMGSGEAPFHGQDGLEPCVKVFAEFGVDRREPRYAKCIGILLERKDGDPLYSRGLSKKMGLFEDAGFSASRAIRASLLAAAGIEDEPSVREEILRSLECFKAVTGYGSLEDFAEAKRGRLVFRKARLFPDYYRLRILAMTEGWKDSANLAMLRRAFRRLIALQPLPDIHVMVDGQPIAPGSYLMHEFDTPFTGIDDHAKARWLLRTEYLARMGLLGKRSAFRRVAASLADRHALERGIMEVRNTASFCRWGAYPGLSLEDDWRRPERRINDLAFRIGLIEHYAGKEPGEGRVPPRSA
jgi:hypothetical protein